MSHASERFLELREQELIKEKELEGQREHLRLTAKYETTIKPK